jgi:hypothetical protein
MTGFEYTAAVRDAAGGMTDEGLKVIGAVRARYDGRSAARSTRRSAGHHYARAMASWAAVLALTGFQYSGHERGAALRGAPDRPCRYFWSNGSAWGTVEQRPAADGVQVRLDVLHGRLRLGRLELGGVGALSWAEPLSVAPGAPVEVLVPRSR